jgi:hypothetical protein
LGYYRWHPVWKTAIETAEAGRQKARSGSWIT